MFFTVLSRGQRTPANARSRAFLVVDNWNDWFEFSTLYGLLFLDDSGEEHDIGGVKIGQFGMSKENGRPDIPPRFDELDSRFFSLGQDDSYYENLNRLGADIRNQILSALHDVALDAELFERALTERVMGISLLRSVSRTTVVGQFRRLANGGVRLSDYRFSYTARGRRRTSAKAVELSFTVEPESQPPTNIHVIIGRNGVGKTYLLNNMALALVQDGETPFAGNFTSELSDAQGHLFANLVSVSFSAFDDFEPLPVRRDKSIGVRYSYVGLKRVGTTEDGKRLAPKSPSRLSREFGESVQICGRGAKVGRWRRALNTLEADPIFKDAEVAVLADQGDDSDLKERATELFSKLSSGHKIVLLTITRLVEEVEERTLVLIDEPEAHLHPPLLSAFVRALSDLLIDRNGVAVIATHSPVVLQEVPRSCVWKVRRAGQVVTAERPDIETFGENVGTLTREVFGLEVTASGFHNLLRQSVDEFGDFDLVLDSFGNELGAEAKAIVRALIAAKKSDEGA